MVHKSYSSGFGSFPNDKYITKDMLNKDSYKGNYYANKNAVMYDLQNGKQNVVCFCDNIYTAQGIVEGLNLLDKLAADGVELNQPNKDKKWVKKNWQNIILLTMMRHTKIK